MSKNKIHIYEENINLFWGLLGLVAIASGTYLLADAFFAGSWQWAGIRQVSSLILFGVGFYAIVQLTEPLYNFIIEAKGDVLTIEIRQGNDFVANREINVNEIYKLKVAPHTPRKENEALFDFSANYHLLYRTGKEPVWQPVIALKDHSFTLKIEDIKRIAGLLKSKNKAIGTSIETLVPV